MSVLKKWLKEQDYKNLITHYSNNFCSKDNAHALSLLYQLTDQYEEENKLVNEALMIHSNWEYMIERRKWHDRDDFDKVVPRPIFRRERNPDQIPNQEDLEKLIFITGGDSNHFTWIMETIESIRVGGFYKDIPIGILDCGLNNAEKHYLSKTFQNIIIKDPGYDFADPNKLEHSWKCGITDENMTAFKAITSRAYLDRHFPGYSYYFWFDSDAWVQDESTIDNYISLAKKQNIGMSENNYAMFCANTMFFDSHYMTEEMQEKLKHKKHATCAGVICFTVKFLENWRYEVLKLYREKEVVNNSPSLWYAIHKYIEKPEFLSHRHQFFFKREGLPLIDEQQVLYGAETKEPCGIIHLNGFYKVRENYRYFPTCSYKEKINIQEHVEKSWGAIERSLENSDNNPLSFEIFQDQTKFSFRYRVWPWNNKEKLKLKLSEIIE